MSRINYDEQTDTHLSKRYNDVLFDCIMRCNGARFVMECEPHFDNLRAYFGAVDVFYMNSFMLFGKIEAIGGGEGSLMSSLMVQMEVISASVRKMKKDKSARTEVFFEDVVQKCIRIHMQIMYGLQRRHMLVRVSESEPTGKESVAFWGDKSAFSKGGVVGR